MSQQKRIYREEEQMVVAGVIAGLAAYFEQDPTLFRVVAVFLLLITGFFPGVLLYIIAWIMIPRRNRKADYTIE